MKKQNKKEFIKKGVYTKKVSKGTVICNKMKCLSTYIQNI